MKYQYSVRDSFGRQHNGAIEGDTREGAAEKLRRDGFRVLSLEEVAGGKKESEDRGSLLPPRISKSQIVYATSQLSIMVDTGLNLSAALESLAKEEENPALAAILEDLKLRVEGGEDFSKALSRHPKHFDQTFLALIRASEETGSLGEMLERVANYLRKDLETRGKVRAAMAYPAVMLVLASGVTLFLLAYVMPKFTPLFERRGVDLPTPTVILLATSTALVDYWPLWLAGAIASIVGLIVAARTDRGRRVIDWCKIHAPVLGPMMQKVVISRSIRTLATMVKSGVSMLHAIELTADVSGNYYYRRAWTKVLDQITQGNRIHDALIESDLFPRTLIQMIGSGEDTGKLDYVLEKVSDYYDKEIETSIKSATSLVEPLLITVMGTVIGGIGLSILLPIFSLSRAH